MDKVVDMFVPKLDLTLAARLGCCDHMPATLTVRLNLILATPFCCNPMPGLDAVEDALSASSIS